MTGRRAVALVAGREIRERLRTRAFIGSTLILLALVGATTALSGALSKETTYRLATTAPVSRSLDAALQRAAKPFDAKVEVAVQPSLAAARAQLEDDDVDAVLLLRADRLIFYDHVDREAATIAESAVRDVRGRVPPTPELAVSTLAPADPHDTDAATLVAVAAALLLLSSLAVYGQWVIGGVVEERRSRVIELILTTVEPRQLLAGKVVGIGLLGLGQLTLVAGLAAILLAAGAFDAPRELGASLALVIPWFALGYALYAVAYAAAGALASREASADTAGQPVTYTLLVAYFAGYAAVSADADGPLAQVLTVFPATAPLVLPARSALVGVPAWQHALAVVLVLVSIYGLVLFAGRAYARGLLHAGGRLSPAVTWRSAERPGR